MTRRVRMQDVADRAGVSQPTVSLVLSGRPGVRVSEAVRRRILRAAADLRYRPNGSAKALVTGRTEAVAFVYDETPGFLLHDPFCSGVAAGVIAASGEKGVSLIFSPFDERKRSVLALDRRLVDGALYLAAKREEAVAHLAESGFPYVLVNPDVPPPPEAPALLLEDREAGRIAARRVEAAGHRRVLFVSATWKRSIPPAFEARADGVRDVLPRARVRILPFDESVGDAYRLGRAAAGEVGDETAAICANDMIAWGLLDALRERGRDVPASLSVVGVDGLDRRMGPPAPVLSTAAYDEEAVGRRALDLLLKRMRGKGPLRETVAPVWRDGETLAPPPPAEKRR